MLTLLGDLMARLGGADPEILAQVPQERTRFIQMAGVLLTTSGIAVVSMTFALHNGVREPLGWALLFGLLWGAVILNIDRFLVLSMGSVRNRWRLFWISLPRFALAFVLALVISTPLVLRIFASDINAQLFTMQLQQSRQQAKLEANTKEQKEANQLRSEIQTDNETIAGKLPVAATSPELQTAENQVATLTPEVQKAQQKEITARAVWQCELYGTGPGCDGASGRPGPGPIAQAKQQTYEADLRRYQQLNSELTKAQSAVTADQKQLQTNQASLLAKDQAQARQQLPGLTREYGEIEAFLRKQAANGTKANDENTGILAQLQALSEVSAKNSSLEAAHLAVLALFFLIEILPVTVKFLLNLGPLSTYEEVAKSRDGGITDDAHLQRAEKRRRGEAGSKTRTKTEADARAVEEGKSKARLKVEEDMRDREVDLGKHANAYVAGEMKTILDVALHEWSQEVRARLKGAAGGPAAGAPPGAGAGAPAAPPAPEVGPGLGPAPGPGAAHGPVDGSSASNGSAVGKPAVTYDFGLPNGDDL